jgi:4-hydroxy-tetrahydrodipicolinate synthase
MRPDVTTLRGSIVPMITPFTDRGEIDDGALGGLIDRAVEAGSHGISVTGTTGEPSALTLDEREHVMRLGAEAVTGRVPFVPGTGTNNLDETIRLTKAAEALGADAALVIVPYYSKPSQEGLYRYFTAVADATELPLVIYNIPGRTAVNMAPATMARLRRDRPRIVGVKESNTDFEHVTKVLFECGRDFLVFSGIELLCYPMLAIGGAGHVSATANILPAEVARLYDLVAAGKWEDALDLHYELLPLNEALFLETNPGPLKWALGKLGIAPPYLRPPLAEPGPETQRRLEEALSRFAPGAAT